MSDDPVILTDRFLSADDCMSEVAQTLRSWADEVPDGQVMDVGLSLDAAAAQEMARRLDPAPVRPDPRVVRRWCYAAAVVICAALIWWG